MIRWSCKAETRGEALAESRRGLGEHNTRIGALREWHGKLGRESSETEIDAAIKLAALARNSLPIEFGAHLAL